MGGLGDLICPESCAGCGRMVRGGLCLRCLERMPRIAGPVCGFCGRPCSSAVDRCGDCQGRDLRFDSARQAVEFSPAARRVIHRFKYSGCRSLARPLAALIGEIAKEHARGVDAVTWVAPSPERLRRTGTDHGRELAGLVGGALGVAALQTVFRVRPARPQMALDPAARRSNLIGAFQAVSRPPSCVLLVDDVFTTGSTVSEVARALKSAGTSRVVVLCVARSFAQGPQARSGKAGAAGRGI